MRSLDADRRDATRGARARSRPLVSRPGARRIGQDRAPDPALPRAARAGRAARADRRDDVHAQGGGRDARAHRRRAQRRARARRPSIRRTRSARASSRWPRSMPIGVMAGSSSIIRRVSRCSRSMRSPPGSRGRRRSRPDWAARRATRSMPTRTIWRRRGRRSRRPRPTTRRGGACSRTSTTMRPRAIRAPRRHAGEARAVDRRVAHARDRARIPRRARGGARRGSRRRARGSWRRCFPPSLAAALADHERYAAANLAGDAGDGAVVGGARRVRGRGRNSAARRCPMQERWCALADWLLVEEGPAIPGEREREAAAFLPAAGRRRDARAAQRGDARVAGRARGGRRAGRCLARRAALAAAAIRRRCVGVHRSAARNPAAGRRRAHADVSRGRHDRFHARHARGARRAGRRGRSVGSPAQARLPDLASAGRRIPGHVVPATRSDPAADGGLAAGRRPDAVRRRRSDAVDLSLPRRRGAAVRRGAGKRSHRRRAGREPRPAAQFPVAAGARRLDESRCSPACWAAAAIRGAASSASCPRPRRAMRRPAAAVTFDVVRRCGGEAQAVVGHVEAALAEGRGRHRDPGPRARASRCAVAGVARRAAFRLPPSSSMLLGRAAGGAGSRVADARARSTRRSARLARRAARAVVRAHAAGSLRRRRGRRCAMRRFDRRR